MSSSVISKMLKATKEMYLTQVCPLTDSSQWGSRIQCTQSQVCPLTDSSQWGSRIQCTQSQVCPLMDSSQWGSIIQCTQSQECPLTDSSQWVSRIQCIQSVVSHNVQQVYIPTYKVWGQTYMYKQIYPLSFDNNLVFELSFITED